MGLPVEETIGGRGQTGEQVKGTGGRSYVVRPMSKTRLGGDSDGRQVRAAEGHREARTADGQWRGRAREGAMRWFWFGLRAAGGPSRGE